MGTPVIDPLEKAAECARALECAGIDSDRRMLLIQLRDYWISLANERAMGLPDWEALADKVINIHSDAVALVH
jgi:hypothetical protein